MAGNYQKEKVRTISTTDQEIDAWEALRREPGLIGSLARRGKRMKPSYVGGRRSFSYEDKDERMDADLGDDRGAFETRPDVIQSRSTAAGRSGNVNASSGSGGAPPAPRGPSEAEIRAKIAEEESTKKKEAKEKQGKEWTAERKKLHGEYGDYKKVYG